MLFASRKRGQVVDHRDHGTMSNYGVGVRRRVAQVAEQVPNAELHAMIVGAAVAPAVAPHVAPPAA